MITSAVAAAGTLSVDYDLDVPFGTYRVEFFVNPAGADLSGYGEGEVFAGADSIGHGGPGIESFNYRFVGAGGDTLTATATEDTSRLFCSLDTHTAR